jgi:hypothetical protein
LNSLEFGAFLMRKKKDECKKLQFLLIFYIDTKKNIFYNINCENTYLI